MNSRLRKEIARHIFDRFELLMKNPSMNNFGSLSGIIRDEFVLNDRLVFVDGDRRQEGKVWGVSCEIGKTVVQVLVADTKDDIGEFSILVQAGTLPTYAIRLSEDAEDNGLISFHLEYGGKARWLEANAVVQAKCLIGIESLTDQLIDWKKLTGHKDMFRLLIDFVGQNEDQ